MEGNGEFNFWEILGLLEKCSKIFGEFLRNFEQFGSLSEKEEEGYELLWPSFELLLRKKERIWLY